MKRIIALLLAVIIPAAIIFTGCSSKKEMTPQEYYDGIVEAYRDYSAAIKDLSPLVAIAKDLDSVKAVSASAKEVCDRADKALDKFEKLNPPSKYADKHKKLIASLSGEHRFIKAAEKLLTAKSLSDITSANSELAACNSEQFLTILLELIKELKAEVG